MAVIFHPQLKEVSDENSTWSEHGKEAGFSARKGRVRERGLLRAEKQSPSKITFYHGRLL